MKPEWSTPPHGDFAAYVEKLGARSAQTLSAEGGQQHANVIDDSSSEAARPQRAGAKAENTPAAPGYQPKKAASSERSGGIDVALARRLFGGFVLMLVVLNIVTSMPGYAVSIVLALLAWVALQAFTLIGGGGDRAAELRRRLEQLRQEAARKK